MSERFALEADLRGITGKKVKQLRRAGQIPAVLYGADFETISLTIPERELRHVLAEAGGTQLIELQVGNQTHVALARKVQRDIIRGDLIHVDFYRVAMDRVIRAEVPVLLVGESPVVASREGVVNQIFTSLEIEALPADLIPHLEIDMTNLKEIGAVVLVSELPVPDTVTVLADPTEVVVKVDHMVEEVIEEEEELLAEALSAEDVPVIGRARDEDTEEE